MHDVSSPPPNVATFSIVAYDPHTDEIGVAVQSKFLAVGSVVPWADATAGAIATQAFANTTFGPRGLELLAKGMSPSHVIRTLIAEDFGRASRQVGMVDRFGQSATFTGEACNAWAGGKAGEYYCVQGNLLAGSQVIDAMADAFETSEGDLGARLIHVLEAGQQAGGDKRGRQSAALLIVREGWGFAKQNDRYRDLRVDDHPTPIAELKRIYQMHCELFPSPAAGD